MKIFYELRGPTLDWAELQQEGCLDEPPVESLEPFENSKSVPEEAGQQLRPIVQELAREVGFDGGVLCHGFVLPLQQTEIYRATLVHSSGVVTAQVQARYWKIAPAPLRSCFVSYFTEYPDGTVVFTSAGRPQLPLPAKWNVAYFTDATPVTLLHRHHERLSRLPSRPAVIVTTNEQLRAQCERLHAQLRDHYVAQGIFERAQPASDAPFHADLATQDPLDVIVATMRQQQQASGSWWSGLLTLIVSLALFMSSGLFGQWEFTAMLVPVLFFHELGHWLAMRVFGYRNTKMFFIPFLGAAVTGTHYNIAGWKKAVVSLMGPVPGILLGCVLGVVALVLDIEWLRALSLLLLTLNGFNLLPVLPLDGGWVLHTVLFSRHPLLDVAFRVLALLLIGLFALTGAIRALLFIGVPLAMGLPAAYKVATVTRRLRNAAIPETPPDELLVPWSAGRIIAHAVREAMPKHPPANLAVHSLQVYEALNSRPPQWLGTLAILFAHGFAFFAALVMAILLVAAHPEPPPQAPAAPAPAVAPK